MKSWLFLLLLIVTSTKTFSRPPEESEFLAATLLGEEISGWIIDLEKPPTSISIFSVYANFPFDQDYAAIIETEILKNLTRRGIDRVTSCSECRAPQVTVEDQRLVIRKGTPDLDTLRRIGSKQPVESFLTVDIYRTKMSVLVQAVLYQNPTGMVIAAERFRIPALNITDAAVQFMLTYGIGKALTTASSSSGATSLASALNIQLLEELGFGKGGVNLGFVLSGTAGTLIYFNPTLAFRGRFGSSGLAWSLAGGMGYGFTTAAKGFLLKGAYDIYLGSLSIMGFEGSYLIPQDGKTSPLSGFIGLHFGIAFGR